MEKITFRREWIILLVILAPLVYVAFIWNSLPDRIPTHFDINGNPNDYSSKAFGTLLFPAINIGLYFLLLIVPRIDPRYKNYPQFQKSYYAIRVVIHVFNSVIGVIVLQAALNSPLFSTKLIMTAVFLLLAFIGNYMRTVRPNFFIGIRTPWTLSNEEVWKRTHEMGGGLLFYGGIILALVGLVLPGKWTSLILLPAIILITLCPVVYSYLLYRKIKQP